MNSKDLLDLALKSGWEIKRHKGTSHITIQHKETGKIETIPYHGSKDVPKGTLHKILKRIGGK